MLKWEWGYNLRHSTPQPKGALTFGTMCHSALELWYPPGRERGIHPAETFARIYDEQPDVFSQWDEEGNRVPARDLGIAMMNGYVEQYGEDKTIEILQPEIPMQIDILDRNGKYLCTFVCKGDAAYRDLRTGRVGFLEHKTAKAVPEEVFVNTGYGDAALAYYWAAELWFKEQGWLEAGEHVDHVRFNWLKKALPDSRPRNESGHYLNKPGKDALAAACEAAGLPTKGTIAALSERLVACGYTEFDIEQLGEVSKVQTGSLFSRFQMDFGPGQLARINERLRHEAYMMAQARAGKIPILKNPTKDCAWKCEFKNACELHEMGGDWESVLELEMVPWDPYSDHEMLNEKGH